MAEACVYHSHNYGVRQEFERYFDIGVFHSSNPWIFGEFGRAGGEGLRYALSAISYVGRRKPWQLARVACSLLAKWVGYKLGLAHRRLPRPLRNTFSMYKPFWR